VCCCCFLVHDGDEDANKHQRINTTSLSNTSGESGMNVENQITLNDNNNNDNAPPSPFYNPNSPVYDPSSPRLHDTAADKNDDSVVIEGSTIKTFVQQLKQSRLIRHQNNKKYVAFHKSDVVPLVINNDFYPVLQKCYIRKI
jgi:hypothetical protein